MSALMEIAARVEAATGADRELDGLIAEAIGVRIFSFTNSVLIDPFGKSDARRDVQAHSALAYTGSIDAAMSLVPEGYWWKVGHVMGPQPLTQNMSWAFVGPTDSIIRMPAPSHTPALALTAAALRARARAGGYQ